MFVEYIKVEARIARAEMYIQKLGTICIFGLTYGIDIPDTPFNFITDSGKFFEDFPVGIAQPLGKAGHYPIVIVIYVELLFHDRLFRFFRFGIYEVFRDGRPGARPVQSGRPPPFFAQCVKIIICLHSCPRQGH